MATRVFDGIKFCEQFLKRTSQETFLPSLVQISPVVWDRKMFKEIVDDAQRMTGDRQDHHKTSLCACCAQVSYKDNTTFNMHRTVYENQFS